MAAATYHGRVLIGGNAMKSLDLLRNLFANYASATCGATT